jgi:glucose/arabinose dehydrogenase
MAGRRDQSVSRDAAVTARDARRRVLNALALLLAMMAMAAPAAAHGVVHGFVDEAVTSGLSLPVAFTTLPDGRVLIAEKAGVVRVVAGGRLLPDAFIDLRARVNDYWDRGLLGVAADPAFAQNGFVYLFYVYEDDPFTYSGPKTSRVVRVTATGDEADPATEVVLVSAIPADSPSHNGGALRFGPDGALWITTGDASSFNAVDIRALRTQQLDSLAGKLLRVGPDGRGLTDNPYWNGDADAVRSKVYAYGFRNPFRLTFRPATGRPYVADVGANDWEEVNAVVRGGNHGWPCVEGPQPQAGYQALAECQALYAQGASAVSLPLVTYPHVPGTASVTGGAFYTGTTFPDLYRGAYFFGDFSRGTLHYVPVDGADAVAGPIKGFGTGIDGVVDVQADATGLLYLSVTAGELRRVRYVPDTGPRQTLYLSDAISMVTAATNGSGPIEIDRSHGGPSAGDGGLLTLGGEPYAKGLGVLAPSDIRVALGGVCTSFTATVGVDDATGGAGSVTFEVWLDGARVVASGIVRGGVAPLSGTLDVSGRQELRLVVTNGGDGSTGDHADWAEARLECTRSGGDTVPPVVVATSPVAGGVAVETSTTIGATLSEDLRATSVGAGALFVEDVASSTAIAGGVSYDAAARRVVFRPQAPLAPGVAYRVTMAAGAVADAAGNTLAASTSWTFTTAALVTNQAPQPVMVAPAAGSTFAVGDVITFGGSATDTEDGALAPASLHWAVSVRHCPGGVCHTHPLTSATGTGGSFVAPEHGADSYLVLTLTATDSGGRPASVSRDIRPRLVSVTLRTEPPGLPVVFGESRGLSPATFAAVVGSHMTVATLSPQHSLTFTGWASGRSRQHALTIGPADHVDTAFFVPPPGVSYVSDLQWASATNGAGPVERDRSHGEGGPGDGPPITLGGVSYAKGLGVLAASDVRLRLNGACSAFAATVGIDDDVQGGGSVYAGVIADGRLVWVSGAMTGVTPAAAVTADLTGVDELRLVVVDAGDGNVNDEVDWADARVTCAGPGASAPVPPGTVTALASGQTAGLWWAPVPGAAFYRLEAGSGPDLADLAVFELPAHQFTAVVPSGRFFIRVRAVNAWGMSAASPEVVLVVNGATGVPDAPGALAAAVVGNLVTLTWAPPATGTLPEDYVVEASIGGGAFVPVIRTGATTFTAAGVPAGSYAVRVRAANSTGVSVPSAAVTVSVP